MTVPWGDVASAYHTTGIPNIEVYTAVPRAEVRWIERLRWVVPLASLGPVQSVGRWWISRRIHGPDSERRARDRAEFWGRVTDDRGRVAEATLETPNGYTLTVQTALAAVEAISAGGVPAGFATPARAFGADFLDQWEDVFFHWIRRPQETETTENDR